MQWQYSTLVCQFGTESTEFVDRITVNPHTLSALHNVLSPRPMSYIAVVLVWRFHAECFYAESPHRSAFEKSYP